MIDAEVDHDRALVRACLRGDREAWKALVDEHYDVLFAKALEEGASPAIAGIAVNEAFEIVFRCHLSRYERWDLAGWRIRNLLVANVMAVLNPALVS